MLQMTGLNDFLVKGFMETKVNVPPSNSQRADGGTGISSTYRENYGTQFFIATGLEHFLNFSRVNSVFTKNCKCTFKLKKETSELIA